MFVTNKRIKLPLEIIVDSKKNNKIVEIKVHVVNNFKLLGITIDNKFNFLENKKNC